MSPGAALAVHPGIGALSFTGSVPTGRLVAARAMETGPRVLSLELGGKNAMVVLEDADIDLAIDGALFGAFGTSGQRCTSTSRLVVHRSVATSVVEGIAKRAEELVLGDPLLPTTDVGPVIDRRSAERILSMIEAAVREGATIATGGHLVEVEGCDGGAFVAPTVLTGVRPDHTIARQEVFGPGAVRDRDRQTETRRSTSSTHRSTAFPRPSTRATSTPHCSSSIASTPASCTSTRRRSARRSRCRSAAPSTRATAFARPGTRGIEQFSQVKTVYVDYSGRLQKAQIDTHPDTAANRIR